MWWPVMFILTRFNVDGVNNFAAGPLDGFTILFSPSAQNVRDWHSNFSDIVIEMRHIFPFPIPISQMRVLPGGEKVFWGQIWFALDKKCPSADVCTLSLSLSPSLNGTLKIYISSPYCSCIRSSPSSHADPLSCASHIVPNRIWPLVWLPHFCSDSDSLRDGTQQSHQVSSAEELITVPLVADLHAHKALCTRSPISLI